MMSKARKRRVSICLIAVSSPSHYSLWNALSVETLAGDLRGAFPDDVFVTVTRIQQPGQIDSIVDRIPANVDVVGLSVELGSLSLTRRLVTALESSGIVKDCHAQLVFGNALPTHMPRLFLDMCSEAFVIRGEGELSMRGVVSHVREGCPLEEVPSLVYRREGVDHETPWVTPDLASLRYPPALDTIDAVLPHKGNVLVESSRGCPWSQCTYCSVRPFRNGRLWEPLPFERVVENLDQLLAAGIREFEFADPDFLGGRATEHTERLSRLSLAMQEMADARDTAFTFRVFLTPHMLYRPGEVEVNTRIQAALVQLKQAGLVKVYLGIESGCKSQLKRYRKGNRLEDIGLVLKMLRRQIGVEVDVGFLLFDPDLTIEEMVQDVRFFREYDLIKGNQWPFRPVRAVPGTPLCETLRTAGRLKDFDENLVSYGYDFSDPRVQRIADAVDLLSAETREVFYALKVVAKLQMSSGKRTAAAAKAAAFVEANARIYLDLLDRLAESAQEAFQAFSLCVEQAGRAIDALVDLVAKEVESGSLQEHADFLGPRIAKYFAQRREEVAL